FSALARNGALAVQCRCCGLLVGHGVPPTSGVSGSSGKASSSSGASIVMSTVRVFDNLPTRALFVSAQAVMLIVCASDATIGVRKLLSIFLISQLSRIRAPYFIVSELS